MAGGVLKGFGIPLILLGILLMLGGIGSAGYGAYLSQETEDDGIFADPDEQDAAGPLLVAGGIAFAAGLVLLILGIVLNAAGNGRRHRELVALATRKADVDADAEPSPLPARPAPKKGARAKTTSSR